MTDAITYAQSLTQKTVKGMLTCPVTILNCSFFRKDISNREIAFHIALALKDEVMDFDVISIETSGSKGEIIEKFEKIRCDHGIGLGVYAIHSQNDFYRKSKN